MIFHGHIYSKKKSGIGRKEKRIFLLELDLKASEHKEDIDTKSQETWKKRNEEGFVSVHASMQHPNAPKLESLIGMRIEYLSSIDTEKAVSETYVLWMGGTVERVNEGTWLMARARKKCYKEGEAAEVYWDAVP